MSRHDGVRRGLTLVRQGRALPAEVWDGLTRFLDDPRVPLDNNAAERALRSVVLGRKNFFGTRSKRGAHVASILYSLIGTAHLRGLEPGEYLRRAALAAIERPGAVTLPG